MSGIVAQNINRQSGLIKAPAGGGSWTFIKKLTASSSATLDFVNGTSDVVLDSTYKEYIFYFTSIHPASVAQLTFNGSVDTGSNYNVTKTSNVFNPYHNEDGTSGSVGYRTAWDLAQSTSDQIIVQELGNYADESASGYLRLYNPASTTFVKHYIGVTNYYQNFGKTGTFGVHYVGYCNTTSAVDAVRFQMSSGNIDAGSIFLHGLTT